MKSAGTLGLVLCLGVSAPAQTMRGLSGAPRPGNVLLIVADEIGNDRVGAYGENPNAPATPVLDSMAARGVLFRNAYSYPTCSPTRALIMTGRYGFRTGVGEVIVVNSSVPALPYDEITLPELLDLGTGGRYEHALVGKWHLGSASFGGAFNALEQGWRAHLGVMGNTGSYTSWTKYTNGVPEANARYVTTDQVDDAIAFTHTLPEPWFVCLSLTAAHTPYHAPPAGLHSQTLRGSPASTPVAHFDAAVQALDTELGRLLSSMPPAVKRNTTFLFIGDNGPPGAATTPPYSPGATKGFLFEGGINVPLIACGREVLAAGGECAALVSAIDLYATVAQLAGFDARSVLPSELPLDSVSLVPYFVDPTLPADRFVVYSEKFSPNGVLPPQTHARALRDERWKLIERDGAPDQFYDLQGVHLEGADLLRGTLDEEQQAAYDALKDAMTELVSG
jgi:arylsulfatase A-like enzyme